MRQQLVDPRDRVAREPREDVGKVLEGVDAVHLAGGDDGVEAGDVLPGVIVSDEEVVLAPERRRPERSLGGVMPRRRLCRARRREPTSCRTCSDGGAVGNAA